MARRRSPYVTAASLYRTSRIPGRFFLFEIIINLAIFSFQFIFWLISMIPSLIELMISVFQLIYHVIEMIIKISFEYLKPKIVCIYDSVKVKYSQFQLRKSR